MHLRTLGGRVGAALFCCILLAGLPAVARATPGPADARPSPARGAVMPREFGGSPGTAAPSADPADAVWQVSTRGALLPRAGLRYPAAHEQGPGPAQEAARYGADGEAGVSADQIPRENVSRGAVVPVRGAEPGAGVGATSR